MPIVTVIHSAGELMGYQMKRDSFYLPYLSLIQGAQRNSPGKIDRYGYRLLSELSFEADELAAVAEAAHRVAQEREDLVQEFARLKEGEFGATDRKYMAAFSIRIREGERAYVDKLRRPPRK